MADSNEPRKETVRIHLPTQAPQAAKTEPQSLADLPKTETLTSMVAIGSPAQPVARIAEVPMSLCWGLLAGSAAILILQIWNYLS